MKSNTITYCVLLVIHLSLNRVKNLNCEKIYSVRYFPAHNYPGPAYSHSCGTFKYIKMCENLFMTHRQRRYTKSNIWRPYALCWLHTRIVFIICKFILFARIFFLCTRIGWCLELFSICLFSPQTVPV